MKEFPRCASSKDPFKQTVTVTVGVSDDSTPARSFDTTLDSIFQSRDLTQHMVMLDLTMAYSSSDRTLDIRFKATNSEEDHVNQSSIHALYDTLVEQLKPE